ncbi:MAG: tetratricopeptide repeat protein [Bryobacteraceae bacterium]
MGNPGIEPSESTPKPSFRRADFYGPDHPNVAIRRPNLGWVLKDLGEYEAAREQLEQALASHLRSFGLNHVYIAIDRFKVASVLHRQSDDGRALAEVD